MRRKLSAVAGLIAGMVAVGAITAPVGAQTPTARTYEVKTGAELGRIAWDFRMFPQELTVHPGDVLHFDWGSVVVLPVGQTEVPEHLDSFVSPDPDDNGFKIDGSVFFPSEAGTDCGLTADDPCVFDGTNLIYPGDRDFPEGFYVKIAESLDKATFLVSNGFKELTVHVDSAATQSPAEDPNFDAEVAAATEEARQIRSELVNLREFTRTKSGAKIWTAYSGYDTDHIAFFEMFPASLPLRRGDRVRWNFAQNVVEPHTASAPPTIAKKWAERAFGSMPVCDPDGDDGPGPDTAADLQEPPFCTSGHPELDLPNKFAKEQGDGRYPNASPDYETSGLRGGPPGIPDDPYTVKFVKKSGDKPFVFMCAIHWNMKIRLTVK